MKRASVLIIAILFVFIVPMVYGGGTFTPSVIKKATGLSASECIGFADPNYDLYNNPSQNVVGDNSARELFLTSNYIPASEPPANYHQLRHEYGQVFYAKNDANMGALAIRLPPEGNDANGVGLGGYNAPVQNIPAGGRMFTVYLYKAINSRNYWPEDHQLLMQWKGLLPETLNSDPCLAHPPSDPNKANKAQAGDWLKFTFDRGYHLQAGTFYKWRVGFTEPQTLANPGDGNTVTRIYIYINRNQDDIMTIPPPYPARQIKDKYGILLHGTYKWGSSNTYIAANIATMSPSPNLPYWYLSDRDFSFGILPAAAGIKIAYGRQAGDADFDGKVQMSDFAALAGNWQVDKQKSASDMNIPYPYLTDDVAPNTDVIVDNNQPQVFPDVNDPNYDNDSPYVDWVKYNYYYPDKNPEVNDPNFVINDPNFRDLNQLAQSFRAPSTATMGAIAVRFSTGEWPVAEETSGEYTIKVYSVEGPNTVPTSGTLLKTFYGYFFQMYTETAPVFPYRVDFPPFYSSLYICLSRQIHQGAWLMWLLPGGGVNLTAGNYYAFTLEWTYDTDEVYFTDYIARQFRIDITDPCIGGSDYTDGSAFYKTLDANGAELGYVPLSYEPLDANDANSYPGRDLVFAILGTQNKSVCVNDYEFGLRPVVGFNAIAGDVNGDCKVDFEDVAVLAFNWLLSTVQ